MNYTIRLFEGSDSENLERFFIKAYGKETVFQDRGFLQWFFCNGFSAIALDRRNEIIAHYGGLGYNLVLNGRQVSLLWGVNAYTLPEWRGLGINSDLVKRAMDKYDVFGVIGFTSKTASYYSGLGFNMFEGQRFDRYIMNLSKQTFELVKIINREPADAEKKLGVVNIDFLDRAIQDSANIIDINKENIKNFSIGYDYTMSAATRRDLGHLEWRFFNNPHVDYKCLAAVSKNSILAYVITRRERFYPTDFHVTRIVDLFGRDDCIAALLREAVLRADRREDIFVDFYSFGSKYGDIFKNLGFSFLHDEDVGILPQVSAPIEDRPNTCHIGLFSSKYKDEISTLSKQQVFFTRADSDMDRLNNIGQISDEQ